MEIFMKKYQQKTWILFVIASVIVTLVRLYLAYRVPIYGITNAAVDDGLMVRDANNLLNLKWLGSYNQSILVKGISFPLVLVMCALTNIPLTVMFILIWAVSSMVFLFALRPLLKKVWLMWILYVVLLFNPIFTSVWVGMRVYRNALSLSQVLIIMGGMFGVYLRCEKGFRKMLPWAILGGFGLVFFYFTREDAFWIMPFVIVFSVVMVFIFYTQKKGTRTFLRNICLILLPFLCLAAGKIVISKSNQFAYGVSITNEFTEGSFPKALKAMYAADTGDEQLDYVSISYEKMQHLYEYSPALAELKPYLDAGLWAGWAQQGRNAEDNNIEDGWFLWCFRDAAAAAGYHETAQKAQDYYERVYQELTAAFENGTLKKGISMPSALMPPLHKGYLEKLFPSMAYALKIMFLWEDLHVYEIDSTLNTQEPEMDALFEQITNNKLMHSQLRTQEEREAYTSTFAVLNKIVDIYKTPSFWVICASYLSTLFICVCLIVKKSMRTMENVARFLIVLAIYLSLLVLVGGISYTNIASCPAMNVGYLCSGYSLTLSFECLSIVFAVQMAIALIREKLQK